MIINLNFIFSLEEDEKIPAECCLQLSHEMESALTEIVRNWHHIGDLDGLDFKHAAVVINLVDDENFTASRSPKPDFPDDDVIAQN